MPELFANVVVIQEHHEAITKGVKILEGLPRVDGANTPPIRMTVQGNTLFKVKNSEIHARWSKAREDALEKGWRFLPYWRLNGNIERTTQWVIDMFSLLQIGNHDPHYFSESDHFINELLPIPYELMLVPQYREYPAKALLFFATNDARSVDSAIYTEDPAVYSLLSTHLDKLTEQRVKPLFHSSAREDREQFLAQMAAVEAEGSGRLLVKPDLSVMTLPSDFYYEVSPWTEQADEEERDLDRLRELHAGRLDALRES